MASSVTIDDVRQPRPAQRLHLPLAREEHQHGAGRQLRVDADHLWVTNMTRMARLRTTKGGCVQPTTCDSLSSGIWRLVGVGEGDSFDSIAVQ
jgi:hypothetical protein